MTAPAPRNHPAEHITVEQLNALPDGSIVLNHPPTCFVKIGRDGEPYGGQWRNPYVVPMDRAEFRTAEHVVVTATRVLYDPSIEESR